MSGMSPAYRMHNSTGSHAGQARSSPGALSPVLVERMGRTLAAQGFVAAPVALLRGYARLGLSDGELALVLQIWSHWRDERLPCPAVSTLATQLGKTERQVQQILAGLRRRGLLNVYPRHDPGRGQLSNAYDLDPLLRALEALPPDTARSTLGLLPTAGEEAYRASGEGVQSAASHEDPMVRSLVLVSDPPDPPATHELPKELTERIDLVGERLGDAAPASSRTRASRLLARSGLDAGAFGLYLDRAARIALDALPTMRRRGTAGAPNGMPYCFAVLEALLAGRPAPPTRAVQRRALATPPIEAPVSTTQPCSPADATDEDDGHPLWPALVSALAGALAPSVFAHRVRPLRSRLGADGALEVVAADGAAARWLETRLGRRIQEEMEAVCADPPAWRVVT